MSMNLDQSRLGRIPALDFRDRNFRAAPLIDRKEAAQRRSMHWITAKALDQGWTSECVAYAWTQYLLSSPVKNKYTDSINTLYERAQEVDEWPGTDYDGTSVRAGAKVLQAEGYVSTYNWAFSAQTAVDWVLTRGPVVLGTNWYDSMFDPVLDADQQWMNLTLNSPLAGGHAYLMKGVNLDRYCPVCHGKGAARIMNSWGAGWGDGGKVWMCLKDLDRLIREWGEACLAPELKFRPVGAV